MLLLLEEHRGRRRHHRPHGGPRPGHEGGRLLLQSGGHGRTWSWVGLPLRCPQWVVASGDWGLLTSGSPKIKKDFLGVRTEDLSGTTAAAVEARSGVRRSLGTGLCPSNKGRIEGTGKEGKRGRNGGRSVGVYVEGRRWYSKSAGEREMENILVTRTDWLGTNGGEDGMRMFQSHGATRDLGTREMPLLGFLVLQVTTPEAGHTHGWERARANRGNTIAALDSGARCAAKEGGEEGRCICDE